jgi:uncharacterized membrane protein
MPYTGKIVAIFTVLFWPLTVQFFESASRKVVATTVNIIRISTALSCFTILLLLRSGKMLPFYFPAHAWIYLFLSGIVGFFLGDIFLFKAFVEIGSRIVMLIMSLSALLSDLVGPVVLNEA